MEPCGTPSVIMSGSDTDPLMQAISVPGRSKTSLNKFQRLRNVLICLEEFCDLLYQKLSEGLKQACQ